MRFISQRAVCTQVAVGILSCAGFGCSGSGDELVTDDPASQLVPPARTSAVPDQVSPDAVLLARVELGYRHEVTFYSIEDEHSLVLEDMADTDASALEGMNVLGKPLADVYRAVARNADQGAIAALQRFDAARAPAELTRSIEAAAQPWTETMAPSNMLEFTIKKTDAERQAERDAQARRFAKAYGCLGHDGEAWDWLDHLSKKPGCNEDGCVRICDDGDWAVAGAAAPMEQTHYSYGMEFILYNQIPDADNNAYANFWFTDRCENDHTLFDRHCLKHNVIFSMSVEPGRMRRGYSDATQNKWHRSLYVDGPNRLGLGIWLYDAKTHDY